jgi:UDP-2-acetamido-2-deoxy-ribo-hexuluronate aminotransferase
MQALIKEPLLKVPFYDGSRSFRNYWPELQNKLESIMSEGKFSHGYTVECFEKAISEYTQAAFCIAVNSGTDALTLLLKAAGIKAGDEVIVPCYTFIASASSVVNAGATPVFVDIEPDSLTVNPKLLLEAITPDTKAIMPVHLFSQMANMERIMEIASEHNLMVIEDSAEAIGMRWGGTHAGLLGVGGVLSFFPTKTLGAFGDAGMIITNNEIIANRASLMRHHGRTGKTIGHLPGISNEALVCGTNSKMDEIQAAILLTRLVYLEEDIRKREKIAIYYNERLANIPGIRLPKTVKHESATNPVFYSYVIQADNRDELIERLNGRCIGTEVYYPLPLHLQECFQNLDYRNGDFPVAERVCKTALAIPLYPDLLENEIEYVCSSIQEFYMQR